MQFINLEGRPILHLPETIKQKCRLISSSYFWRDLAYKPVNI